MEFNKITVNTLTSAPVICFPTVHNTLHVCKRDAILQQNKEKLKNQTLV